jgi:hypothetical protein
MARAEWQAVLCFFHFSQDSEIQLPVLAALLLPKLPMLEKGGMRTCFGGQNFGTCARLLP